MLAELCQAAGLDVPPLLKTASGKSFYKADGTANEFLTTKGDYEAVVIPEGAWLLKDKTRGATPVAKNGSAVMWDLGDGILGMEFKSKGNTFDPDVMAMLNKSHELVRGGFKGLVVGHDGEHFSFGANLAFFMYISNMAAWKQLSGVVREGQQTFMNLKYAPFPVVVSLAGMAMGGGCELCLHADAVQAHIESYPGLVELGVGVIPGWGGCKEMLFRHAQLAAQVKHEIESGKKPSAPMPQGPMAYVSKAFEYIGTAKVATSAQEAHEMLILNAKSGITMNRRRVLADAKARCLALAENYSPPEQGLIRLPGATGRAALEMALEGFVKTGKATPHDAVLGKTSGLCALRWRLRYY